MMRSLYSGVAGLRTHQTKMDVLGNNIANVNTTSFKSQSITFSDLMYQTTQTASGATETKGGVNARQIGLGAKSGAIATAIEGQGATQTTNNPFDIMITGKAFFVVNNGKENLYTRDGSFYVDGAGNLAMQSNGYFVMGWVAQEDPETGAITVNKNGGLSQLQIMSADNTTYSPASTTAALYSGNLDDNDSNIVSDDGKTVTLEFYDNKGYLYTAKFTIKDTDDENDHLFSVQLTDIIDSEGNSIGSERMESIRFGNVENFSNEVSAEDYTVEVVEGSKPEVAICYLNAGTKLFNGAEVAQTGTLSELMSSKYSKKDYATILSKVYGLSDDYIINQGDGTNKIDGLSKDCKYTIDSDGNLTITLNIEGELTPVDKNPNDGTQDYVRGSNTSNAIFYVDESTLKGYPAIDTTTEMKDVTGTGGLSEATLKTIFGITDSTKLADYLDSTKKYKYTFSVDDSGEGTLKIYNNITLATTSGTTANDAKSIDGATLLQKAGSSSFPTLSAAIVENATTDPVEYKDDLSYTFDGVKLVVYQTQEDTTQPDKSKKVTFGDAVAVDSGASYSDVYFAICDVLSVPPATTAPLTLDGYPLTQLQNALANPPASATPENIAIVQSLVTQATGLLGNHTNEDLEVEITPGDVTGTAFIALRGYGWKTKEQPIFSAAATAAETVSDDGFTKKGYPDVKYYLKNNADKS